MSNWKCPADWKCIPPVKIASQNRMFCIIMESHKHFQHIRPYQFTRCNASGKLIWPFQKAWHGIVGVHPVLEGTLEYAGTFCTVWLCDEQFVIQKLKGNI